MTNSKKTNFPDMFMQSIKMEDIAVFNPENLSNKTSKDYEINYIDIESVNHGAISGYKKYKFIDAPSRARRKVQKNDIIISTVRPYLKALAKIQDDLDNMVCSTGFAVLRVNKEVNSDYIFKYIMSEFFINQLSPKMVGASYPAVSVDDIKECEIPLPSFEEQIKIASVLTEADNLITKRRRAIAKLDELAQSVFQEMFGDLRTNPKGYEVVPFGSLISLLTDYHSNGSYKILKEHVELLASPDYALMVRTTDLEHNNFENGVKYITKSAYEFLKKTKVYGGEIIVNKIGSAGNVYLMPTLNFPVSLGMNQFMIRFKEGVSNIFVYNYLTSNYGKKLIAQKVNGAVTKTITKEDLRSIKIIYPPFEEQEHFSKIYIEIKEKKEKMQEQLKKLEDNFQSLLHQAFTGRLQFREEKVNDYAVKR